MYAQKIRAKMRLLGVQAAVSGLAGVRWAGWCEAAGGWTQRTER